MTTVATSIAPTAHVAPPAAPALVDYASLTGLRGAELRDGLGKLTKSTHVDRGYGGAVTQLFANVADEGARNIVVDMYNGKYVKNVASKWGGWARGLSVEHVWPRSQGATGIANGDLHHLQVAGRLANAIRSNNPFGEVADVTWASKGPKASRSVRGDDGAGRTVFEPSDVLKGDIARSLLYFATRYGADQPDRYDATNVNASLPDLLRWHAADPVSDAERARNEIVQAYQGNRNPFIDHPEFAAQIGVEGFTA